jgi:ABC-type branched-subunit amino acid transport system substrate-binding protein
MPRRIAALCLIAAVALGGCESRVTRSPPPPQAAPLPAAPPPVVATPTGPPAALETAPVPGAQGEQVKVALLLPLSGPNGALGHAMLDAAEMAMFEIAADNFVLLPRDTQGTADGAARAASAVIGEGAELILGPLLMPEVEAVKPLAQQAHINVVAFSTADQLAGDGVYLLSFLAHQNIQRITSFAHAQGATRFAVLAPSTSYGQLITREAQNAVVALGGSIDHVEYYEPTATDLRPVVRRLASYDSRGAALAKEKKQLEAATDEASKLALQRLSGHDTAGDAGFDAVVLPESGARLKAVASLLPYFDIDTSRIHLLGTGIWDQPGLGGEPALVGAWFAAPAPEARSDFERRFQAAYKRAPPRLATLGYDAAALAAVLAQKPVARPDLFSATALTDPNGFTGVDGVFRFLSDGKVERGLAVLQIERNGTRVVDPAPESFPLPAS